MIDVVGVPATGIGALPARERELVGQAHLLIGSPRLLGLVEDRDGQHRRSWPSPMLPTLKQFLAQAMTAMQAAHGADARVVVLATGDPLLSGIGTTLLRVLGPDMVRVHPAVSSVALARARMGWSAEQTDWISLVSAPVAALRRILAPGARIIALSAGAHTPRDIARLLSVLGCGDAALTVLSDLGADTETRLDTTAHALACDAETSIGQLNVVAVAVPESSDLPGTAAGLLESAFEHDGQITKRELRALAISALRPMPGHLLWDLGAGSGSVSVEWCLAAQRARAVAVERQPQRAARIERNRDAWGVPVQVICAASGSVIGDLPAPDAVFIGGGAEPGLIDAAWQALRPGGRLVVPAVTLPTEAAVIAAHTRHGGRLRRILIERAEPLGRQLSWTPARAIVQWSATKQPPPGQPPLVQPPRVQPPLVQEATA